VPPYDAVLFDNDGVLVEPPAPETRQAAVRDAFGAVGVDDPAGDHVRELTASVTVEALKEVGAAYGVNPKRLWAARERHDERSQLAAFRRGDWDRYDPGAETAATDDPSSRTDPHGTAREKPGRDGSPGPDADELPCFPCYCDREEREAREV